MSPYFLVLQKKKKKLNETLFSLPIQLYVQSITTSEKLVLSYFIETK